MHICTHLLIIKFINISFVFQSSVQDYFPDDYKNVNPDSLVNLLCAKDFGGVSCYNRLPLDVDVVSNSCDSKLSD